MDIKFLYYVAFFAFIFVACECFVLKNPGPWAEGADSNTIQVTTDKGVVEGLTTTTIRGTPYASFEGIPFATPPVGKLRFKDTIPAESWTGVLETKNIRDMCYQPSFTSFQGSEDCLYLNVYTPALKLDSSPKSVLVFVHGGAFIIGSTDRNYDNYVDENLVVVGVAYRLGVLGFLSLGTEDVPGNAGMKDLVMALKWVKENVKAFGGDENDVTIYGESAGSGSVSHLQVSPMAKGLFHKVIAVSGTTLCDWAIQKHPERMNEKLASFLGLDSRHSAVFSEDLRSLSAEELNTASNLVQADRGGIYEDLTFVPVVEQEFEGVESFLNKSPIAYITDLEFSDVPTMIGYSSKEYASFYSADTIKNHTEDDLVIVPDRWRLTATDSEVQKMARIIRDKYLGSQTLDTTNKDKVLGAVDMLGDIRLIQPIIYTAHILAQYLTSPVYLYRFSYRGANSNIKIEELGAQGASHVDDGHYRLISDFEEYSSDGWVVRRLLKLLSNFCQTGNPTPGLRNALLPTTWERVTPESVNYVDINGDITPSKDPDHIRRTFWADLENSWRLRELDSWSSEDSWSK